MEDITVVIPSRNEEFLKQTILDIKTKFKGPYEIIVTLDGGGEEPVSGVTYIHNPKARGMRTSINQAVAKAQGKYIMKLDAHCMVAEGIDEKLKSVHKPSWVQVPRRKRFDPHTWKLTETDQPDIDYMFVGSSFRGHKDNDKNRDPSLKNILLDDIEVFQGSCYFMTKDFFNQLGLLDDKNFGTMGSEALEIALKCRNAGGRVLVNKTTWYAHARTKRHYSGGLEQRELSRKYIKILAEKLTRTL